MAKPADHTPPDVPFAGFDVPRQNWFKMPHAWTDITAGITSLAELKVIEYVLKHTWGYQEYGVTKRITVDEFMHGRRRKDGTRMDRGTGLSKPSVVSGIKAAVAHGFLIEVVDDSDLGRVKKYYSLHMLPGLADDDPGDFPGSGGPLPQAPVEDPPHSEGEDEDAEEPESGTAPPGSAGGVKNLNPGVKNLYPDVNHLNRRGKESLHRTEKDTLERKQQEEGNNNQPPTVDDNVVVALQDHGIGAKVARRLARQFEAGYIRHKIDYLTYLLTEHPHQVKKPAAWLRKAIEDDYSAPDGFVSAERREQQLAEQNSRNQAILAAQATDRERRAAAEKAQAAAIVARRDQLRRAYKTTSAAIELWDEALADLRFTAPGGVYAMLVGAEVLQLDEDADEPTLRIGVFHSFHWRQLQHPGYQTAVQRTLKQLARCSVTVEFMLLDEDATTVETVQSSPEQPALATD